GVRALQAGKVVYMAVPRLTHERCFVALPPADLQQRAIPLDVAATHRGAMRYGRLVALAEMRSIDLVIVGCVAVSRDGGRTGKGAGFADLELGILRQLGLVQADTPIVTTVHPLQIVASAQLPMLTHDWSLTWIVTPGEAIATASQRAQPTGLQWEYLRPEQLQTIPVLRTLQPEQARGGRLTQPPAGLRVPGWAGPAPAGRLAALPVPMLGPGGQRPL